MKKLIAVPVLAAALTLGIAGCGKHTTGQVSPSISAEKQIAKNYVDKCVPQNSLAQIQFAQSLANAAQHAKLAQCLGIPQSRRQAFEAAALTDAEHVKWSDKSQRTQFFDVTLPNLALQYRSK